MDLLKFTGQFALQTLVSFIQFAYPIIIQILSSTIRFLIPILKYLLEMILQFFVLLKSASLDLYRLIRSFILSIPLKLRGFLIYSSLFLYYVSPTITYYYCSGILIVFSFLLVITSI